MSQHFVIRNHHGHYWGRGKRWVDGREVAKVASYRYCDEAVNTLFELGSKEIDLRGEVLGLELHEGKLPALEISSIPLPENADNPEIGLELAVSDHNVSDTSDPAPI